ERALLAVERIADQRRAEVRKMRAYLMRSPSEEPAFNQRRSWPSCRCADSLPERLDRPILRYGELARACIWIARDNIFPPVFAGAHEHVLDPRCAFFRRPARHRIIDALHIMLRKQRREA